MNLLADHFILFGQSHTNHMTLFGFNIYFYALAIVTGMISCCLLAVPLFKRRGENPDLILDLMIAIVPISIICARLWYVIFDINSFHSFKEVVNIRNGGLAIYGGVAGGALGITIICRVKKISIVKIFDFGATMLPLGQAIGRLGNFFNQEVYGGVVTNPNLQFFPLAVEIDSSGTVVWHQALFFYEGFLNILAFIGLYLFLMKRKGSTNGYSVAYYFMSYGLIRGILENFRASEYNLPLFGIKIKAMVIVSVLLFLAGAAILVILLKKDGIIFKNKKGEAYENKE